MLQCSFPVSGTWWEIQAANLMTQSLIISFAEVRLRTGRQVWDVWHWGAAESTALNRTPVERNGYTHTHTTVCKCSCIFVSTHIHTCMSEWKKKSCFFTDGASMHPHLGQRTLLLCVLKVNCPAVMGIGRQSGINWHEWAWLQALCGWRRGRRLLSMCPCRWIMCSTFSKAHKQKCQTGSSTG